MSDDLLRIDQIRGTRLCAQCGYNLIHQHVSREPHYNMLIVRCPECGTVASLQEYPVLGRWAARWGLVAAGLWWLLCLSLLFLVPLTLAAFCEGAGQVASVGYQQHLAAVYNETLDEDQQELAPGGYVSGPEFAAWWEKQDASALLQSAGGLLGAADMRASWFWAPIFLASITFGCLWSVVFIHRRRLWIVVWSVALVAMTCVWILLISPKESWYRSWGTVSPWMIARTTIVGPFAYLSCAAAFVGLVVGMWIGRPVIRLSARAFLPKSLQATLSGLWRLDGKEPPHLGLSNRP